ncbi:MAG: hypothetical protein U0103_21835 [Candidatus Obscuribacterales bacterium]
MTATFAGLVPKFSPVIVTGAFSQVQVALKLFQIGHAVDSDRQFPASSRPAPLTVTEPGPFPAVSGTLTTICVEVADTTCACLPLIETWLSAKSAHKLVPVDGKRASAPTASGDTLVMSGFGVISLHPKSFRSPEL